MGDFKWIKVATDIFDNDKMLLIESMPDASEIMIIWFKLLCMAGKSNYTGRFTIGGKPYTNDIFAIIFRRPVEMVKRAMDIFEELGMIVRDNGVVCIKNWMNYQSIEQMEMVREQSKEKAAKYRENQKIELIREQTKDRVAKHREKQKIEQKKQSEAKDKKEDVTQPVTQPVTQDVTQDVTQCNAECNAMCNAECNAIEETIEENREEKNIEEKNRGDKSRSEESKYVYAADTPQPTNRSDERNNDDDILKPISENGRDVVYLTDAQVRELTEKLGDDLYRAYLDRLSTFIIEKRARIRNHRAIILRWYEEDKRNGTLPVTDSRSRELATSKPNSEKEERTRYGDFDPKDAFEFALKRTFGDEYECKMDF